MRLPAFLGLLFFLVEAGCTPKTPPPESAWKAFAPLSNGPRQETGVATLDGHIYVVGGFARFANIVPLVERYDPQRDVWEEVAPLPEALHHCNVAAVNGKLYVTGALQTAQFTATGITLEYDPLLNTWTEKSPMPAGTERGGSAVAVLEDEILVAGGLRGGSVADVSSYNTTTDTWEVLPSMTVARDHLVGGVIGGLFFAAAGRTNGALRGELEIYDPVSNLWSRGADIITPRGGCMGTVEGGKLFVFGGEGNPNERSGVFEDTEAYDPLTDTWEALEPMFTPRHGTGAAALDGVIYVPGGATKDGLEPVDTHEAFFP